MPQTDRRAFLAGAAALAATPALAQGAEDARLRALLDRMFETRLDLRPETATELGLDKGARAPLKAQLDDYSPAGKARRLDQARGFVRELRVIDRARLSAAARVDLDSVLYNQERFVAVQGRYRYGAMGGYTSPYSISQRTGVYRTIPDFLDREHSVETAADAQAYVSRLRAFAVALDQDLDRMRQETALGVTPPDFAVPLTLDLLRQLRDQPAEKTILVTALADKVQKANLAGPYALEAAQVVRGEVFPALDRQIAAIEALRGRAKPDVGAWALPDGEAYYADMVRDATTTDYTPDQVHQMGLEQVREITAQLDGVLKSRGLTQGTVAQRLAALNVDPAQMYPNTPDGRAKILADLNTQMAALYEKLPTAFRTLPKSKVEVRRVPEFIEAGASNGYYQSPSLDGSRPGVFYINLKNTGDWPRYNLPTLAYHEAAPGHHLQIALAQESERIPILRRTGLTNSAYSEGWGLYAEQLADEMGAYADDPFGRAGYLQSLLFRAARLVVDTGIHAKRWSVRQATDYMVETVGQTRSRSQREVERYFISPGQATSYKVGHTVWVRLREDARKRLGPRFDLRAFHDAGLLFGNMPMAVLERHLGEWAASQA